MRVVVGEAAREAPVRSDVRFDLFFPRRSLGLWNGAVDDNSPDSLDFVGDFVREAGLDVGIFNLRDQLFRG